MKGLKRIILKLAILSVCLHLSAQEKALEFPKDYFGVYKGDLTISNQNGEQTLQMEFHLQPTDSVGKFDYKLVYISDGNRQERHYTLIEKNAQTGEYVVDENNGIILNARFVNGTLYSMFEVQGNILTTTERFFEGSMDFEITFASKKNQKLTGSTGDDAVEVVSYPITVVQKTTLYRVKN